MICFVTGASGFIGANLVHELVARGHRVKALLRPTTDLRGLAGVEYERIEGDVSDRAFCLSALRGCDWCFHVAASYHLWLRNYAPMYAANVAGTRHVLEAAMQAGLRDVVKEILDGLTPREAKVLRMRFGIEMDNDHTLEEVGKQFDVTRERIRQIEAKALRKLKHPSRSDKLRSFIDTL